MIVNHKLFCSVPNYTHEFVTSVIRSMDIHTTSCGVIPEAGVGGVEWYFGLPCVSFVKFCQYELFPFWFWGRDVGFGCMH